MSYLCCDVQYARLEDARAAQQNLNGVLEIGGRPIKVILDWVCYFFILIYFLLDTK